MLNTRKVKGINMKMKFIIYSSYNGGWWVKDNSWSSMLEDAARFDVRGEAEEQLEKLALLFSRKHMLILEIRGAK